MSNNKSVLVVGASGLVGSAVSRHLGLSPQWQTLACSRRKPDDLPATVDFVAVDLLDAEDCKNRARQLKQVTHVVYAAINETKGSLIESWADPDHADRNGRMLKNLIDPLIQQARNLQQVVIIHGTKAYGVTLDSPLPVPLRESQPRVEHSNFYFQQEDYIREKAANHSFGWSIFRAQMVMGGGLNSNLNSLLAISSYASLLKEAGEPCGFPGADGTAVIEMTDVELLAKAVAWSLENSMAHNQIFNITNGDVFTWQDIWPVLMKEIGCQAGTPHPKSIATEMDRKADQWSRLSKKYQLSAPDDWYEFLGESCALADFALAANRHVITSTIKLRQAGFHDCLDSHDCVKKWIRHWRQLKLLPPG